MNADLYPRVYVCYLKRPCKYIGAYVPEHHPDPRVNGKRCYWFRYGVLGVDLRDIVIPVDEFWGA